MEINGAKPELVLNKGVQRIEFSQRSELTVKSGGEQSDTDLILSTPDIREDKGEMFQREIQNGTCYVKAEGIAGKFL